MIFNKGMPLMNLFSSGAETFYFEFHQGYILGGICPPDLIHHMPLIPHGSTNICISYSNFSPFEKYVNKNENKY